MAVFEDAARTDVAAARIADAFRRPATTLRNHTRPGLARSGGCRYRERRRRHSRATLLDELPADTPCYRETNAIAVVHAGEDVTASEASTDVNTLIMLFDFNDRI